MQDHVARRGIGSNSVLSATAMGQQVAAGGLSSPSVQPEAGPDCVLSPSALPLQMWTSSKSWASAGRRQRAAGAPRPQGSFRSSQDSSLRSGPGSRPPRLPSSLPPWAQSWHWC